LAGPTKESILYYTRVHADLAVHDEQDLAKLVDAEIEGYYSGTDWSSPAWIDVPTLGTNGYAFKYTLYYPDYPDRVVHDFIFMRDVVYATSTVGLPETAGSERRAIEVARALDDKIKDQIRALSAEVHSR